MHHTHRGHNNGGVERQPPLDSRQTRPKVRQSPAPAFTVLVVKKATDGSSCPAARTICGSSVCSLQAWLNLRHRRAKGNTGKAGLTTSAEAPPARPH